MTQAQNKDFLCLNIKEDRMNAGKCICLYLSKAKFMYSIIKSILW